MVCKTVRHLARVPMIVIEYFCVTLPRPAVVDDDVTPAAALYFCIANLIQNSRAQIPIVLCARPRPVTARRGRREAGLFLETMLFDEHWRRFGWRCRSVCWAGSRLRSWFVSGCWKRRRRRGRVFSSRRDFFLALDQLRSWRGRWARRRLGCWLFVFWR